MTRSSLAVHVLVVALAGCARSGDENLGLPTQVSSYAIDVTHLTRPAELVRALALPGREVDKKIGAHRFEATSTLKTEVPGRPPENLDETYRLDSDGNGALHLVHENLRGGGLEAIVIGGELNVRPRFGKFVRRRPEGDEVDRLRANSENVAADYLQLLERFVLVREEGRVQVAGRQGIKLKLSAATTPTAGPSEGEPNRRWRNTLEVRYIDGELVMDAATGVPLNVRLEAAYAFRKDDAKGPVQVTLSFKQTGAAAESIVAPTDAVSAPQRVRPMLDRQELLEGLK